MPVVDDVRVPYLFTPALPPGAVAALEQPRIPVDGRLVLRPWRPDDAATVREAFDGPDIQRWHIRRLDTDDEALAWVAGWADRWAAETGASWAIASDAAGAVGQLGLRTISLAEGSAQLSYWVLPTARGAGVAVRAVEALTGWAFGTLGLHRLYLMHSTANQPSCRVATKAGYAYEGTLRGHLNHADGWHDVHMHGRLASDQPPTPGGVDGCGGQSGHE